MDSVKTNFSSMHSDLTCDLCEENVLQNTAHLLECQAILDKCTPTVKYVDLYNDTEVEYKHIYCGIKEQLQAIKIFHQVYEIKQDLENDLIGNFNI